MEDHVYLSTACYHGQHTDCRQGCKICGTPCLCECHASKGPGSQRNGLPAFAELLKRPYLNDWEKMIVSAVSLLSTTEAYRAWTLAQIYERIATGADVDIAGPAKPG